MPRKKSFASKLFIGLGKLIGWMILSIFKIIWWVLKGVFKALFHTAKAGVNAVKQKRTEIRESGISSPAKFADLKVESVVKGNLDSFANRLFNDSLIIAIAGKRGSGKSGLGFRILENIYSKSLRPCFALGVRQSVLPKWIKSINSLEEAENKGVVLVDEGAVSFGSRQSMSKKNKDLGGFLAVARHNDLTLLFITQNTGMIDKNVLNLCDTIMLKEGSLLQLKMERSAIKDLYQTADAALSKVPSTVKKKYFYVFDSDFEGLLIAELPSFWSSSVSKSHAKN